MNRITQILTKYRIGLAKAGDEPSDEQIDILTDKAGEALLEWLDKKVIGENEETGIDDKEENLERQIRNTLRRKQKVKARK